MKTLQDMLSEVTEKGADQYTMTSTCRVGNPTDTYWEDADFSRPCGIVGRPEPESYIVYVLISQGTAWLVGEAVLNNVEGEGKWSCTCALPVPLS